MTAFSAFWHPGKVSSDRATRDSMPRSKTKGGSHEGSLRFPALERVTRFERATPCLGSKYSTAELHPLWA